MKRYDNDCNISISFSASIVADKVDLDGAAGKYVGEYVTFKELSEIKGCSYVEANYPLVAALEPLDDYIETFSKKLRELCNNELGALLTHANFNPMANTFIDYNGDVLVCTDFMINVYIKDLDDGCDPYEDTCYLIDKAMNYANGGSKIELHYDTDVC